MRIETRGFPELERDLKALGPAVTQFKVLSRALRGAMRPVLHAAKAFVPVDTGVLRDSIKLRVFKPRAGMPAAAAVGVFWRTNARGVQKFLQPFYAQFVERGTRRQAAKPFLRPAFDQSEGKIVTFFRDELGRAIDSAVRRKAREAAKRVV